MNWLSFAAKIPVLLIGAMKIVEQVKSAAGADKKQAVLAAVPDSEQLVNFAVGREVLNDPSIQSLMSAAIDAEAAAMKAHDALKSGILAHPIAAAQTAAAQ